MIRPLKIAALATLGAVAFAVAPASAQIKASAIPQQSEAPPVSGVAPMTSPLQSAKSSAFKQGEKSSRTAKRVSLRGVLTPSTAIPQQQEAAPVSGVAPAMSPMQGVANSAVAGGTGAASGNVKKMALPEIK
jgi:hypothetical protein